MPKIKQVTTLPKCDFCGADAKYDAPTKRGSWAYLCTICINIHSSMGRAEMGTEFVLRSMVTQSLEPKTVEGLEPESLDYWQNIIIGDDLREIECPTCSSTHEVEPDADYEYRCECGDTIKVPCPAI